MKTDNFNKGHRKRVQNKFLKHGGDTFFEYELIELLLMFAKPRCDVKPIAKTLIEEFGDIQGILDASDDELLQISGVGEYTLTLFRLVKTLNYRYLQQKANQQNNISDQSILTQMAKVKIAGQPNEMLFMIFLDKTGKILATDAFDYGDRDQIVISSTRIIKSCFSYDTAYLFIAHNHPSGFCVPSKKDISFTQELQRSLKLVKICLLDHVIVSKNSSFSMRDSKIL